MTAKKKEPEDIIEKDVEQLDKVEEKVAAEPICLNCRFYAQDAYFGPKCSNPASPFNGQRMAEHDTCEKFTAKA